MFISYLYIIYIYIIFLYLIYLCIYIYLHIHLFIYLYLKFLVLLSHVLSNPVIWLSMQFNRLVATRMGSVGNYWLTWNLLECSSFAGIFRVRFSLAFWMIFNNFILFFVCATRKRRDIFRAEKLNVVSNDHWHRWKCDFSVRPEILLFLQIWSK